MNKLLLAAWLALGLIGVSTPVAAAQGADDPAGHVRQCRGCDDPPGHVRHSGDDDKAKPANSSGNKKGRKHRQRRGGRR